MILPMQDDLTDMLRDASEQAAAAFPARLARLLVFFIDSEAAVYISPDIAQALTERTTAVKNIIAKSGDHMRASQCIGLAYHPQTVAGQADVRMIAINPVVPNIITERCTRAMRIMYVFDHELGHQVVENGMMGGHRGECLADAFAALRHIQRFGHDTDFFKLSLKATQIVFGLSPKHYTQDIFDAAQAYARRQDISKLSLQQTAILARDIVNTINPDTRKIYRLSRKFLPAAAATMVRYPKATDVMNALQYEDKEAYRLLCREVAKVMLDNRDDTAVQIAGQRFLNYPPLRTFIDERAKINRDWQTIARLADGAIGKQIIAAPMPQRKFP